MSLGSLGFGIPVAPSGSGSLGSLGFGIPVAPSGSGVWDP